MVDDDRAVGAESRRRDKLVHVTRHALEANFLRAGVSLSRGEQSPPPCNRGVRQIPMVATATLYSGATKRHAKQCNKIFTKDSLGTASRQFVEKTEPNKL